ncbi:MAG: methyltransferase domain-containing protein [Parvularculaceae bacterium]
MNGGYHETRLKADAKRDVLWRALWRYYFRRRVPANGCILDLGAGYGQFINNAAARRRIAIDAWPGLSQHLDPGVEAIIGDVCDLSRIEDASVDYAFASNLFEHLPQDRFAAALVELKRILCSSGTLTILQPNYAFAYREYFDDFTHVSIWSHVSIADFLEANGFEVVELHARFLPLTLKSRLPVFPWLIAAYLASPVKPLAKQMLVVARPRG